MLITSGRWKDKETRLRSVTQGNFSNDELVTEFSQKIRFQCMSIERHEMNTMVITGSNQKKRKRHNEAKPLETLIIFDIQMENTVIKKTTQNYLSTLIKPHSNFPQSDVGIRRTPLSRSGSISQQSVTSTHANITNVSSFSSSFVACWLPEICLLQGQTARRTHA